MKNKIKLLLVLSIVMTTSYAKEGITFFSGTYKEAVFKAKTENKHLFLEFYTDWCGPCKKMDKYVFTNEMVGSFYNKNFINLKIDAEKGEGIALAEEFKVRSYPTQLILDSQTNLIQRSGGYKNVDMFLQFGQSIFKTSTNDFEDLKREYEAGNRTPEFVQSFIERSYLEEQAIMEWGEEKYKLMDYIRSVSEEYILSRDVSELLNSKDFFIIYYMSVRALDDRIYGLLVDNYEEFANVVNESELATIVTSPKYGAAISLSQKGDKKYRDYLKFLFKKFKRPAEFLKSHDSESYGLKFDENFFTKYCDMQFAFAKNQPKKGASIAKKLLKYRVVSDKHLLTKTSMVAQTILEHKEEVDNDFLLMLLSEAEKAASTFFPLKDKVAIRIQLAELNALVGKNENGIAVLSKLKDDILKDESLSSLANALISNIDKKLEGLKEL